MLNKNLKQDKFPKINKILFVETKNKYYELYQNWYFSLKRNCKKLIDFDPRWNTICYGKKTMNKKFLEFVKEEKPDYIFMWIKTDQFYFDTLLKIREFSPKTQIFTFFGDDDTHFENFSRYLVLFVDYGLIVQKKYLNNYKKEGIKNVFYTTSLDTQFFRPINLEKKYDVSFIGSPKIELTGRYEFIKFLKDNGISISVFGRGWENYPELKEIYKGALTSEEMLKVLNQSKINLCLSKNNYGGAQLKGKVFEGGACKTFVLTEYCKDYLDFFEQGKEIIMFKDKKELLDKIKYYLKNEKEREKIAERAYKKIINNYNLDVELSKIFKKIHKKNKDFVHKELPKINKKLICLSKKDLNYSAEELKSHLKDYDYVFFAKGECENLKYRKYLQAYSLEKSKKPISCCDYYLHSKYLGDYLTFRTKGAFNILNKKDFISTLNINQLMLTKDYFLKNINKIRRIFMGSGINFINDKNTVFVSFPLVRIKKINFIDYKTAKKAPAFNLNFLYKLYSLKHQKKLFSLGIYFLAILYETIKGKKFILNSIIETLKDKDKKNKLNSFKNIQE